MTGVYRGLEITAILEFESGNNVFKFQGEVSDQAQKTGDPAAQQPDCGPAHEWPLCSGLGLQAQVLVSKRYLLSLGGRGRGNGCGRVLPEQ